NCFRLNRQLLQLDTRSKLQFLDANHGVRVAGKRHIDRIRIVGYIQRARNQSSYSGASRPTKKRSNDWRSTTNNISDVGPVHSSISRLSAMRRAQPLPNVDHVARSVMKRRRIALYLAGVTMDAAEMVRGPMTPSCVTPAARWSHLMAWPGPLFTAASKIWNRR